jgi:hypothetical protein
MIHSLVLVVKENLEQSSRVTSILKISFIDVVPLRNFTQVDKNQLEQN